MGNYSFEKFRESFEAFMERTELTAAFCKAFHEKAEFLELFMMAQLPDFTVKEVYDGIEQGRKSETEWAMEEFDIDRKTAKQLVDRAVYVTLKRVQSSVWDERYAKKLNRSLKELRKTVQ